MKNTLFITIFLFLSYTLLSAQENPFIKTTDKNKAGYIHGIYDEYLEFSRLDTVEAQRFIWQIEETAQRTGSRAKRLQAEYFELTLFHKKQILYGEDQYPTEEMLLKAFELLNKIQKAGVPQLELMIRYNIIETYWLRIKNYELAFEQCANQDKLLEVISSDDIPEKALYYIQIADCHYSFKDYSQALYYFSKVLEESVTPRNELPKQSARNGIGLSLRYGYNDLDRSDSCFQAITQVEYLALENEYNRDNWDGIAEGNIGYNRILRGEYDKAIPLLKSSIEKMLKYNDYAYASGPAINLADIYLKKGNIPEAKNYIDLAREYYNMMPRDGRLSRIYEVMNKYYAATGNAALSMAYLDSMLTANRRHEEQFNAMILLRMEQKESAQRQSELMQEKEIRQQTQFRLLILSAGFIIISGLLCLLFVFYRRKRAAHRILARKVQELAQVSTGTVNIVQIIEPDHSNKPAGQDPEMQNSLPDETDFSIMKAIEQLMSEEKLYRDSSLTIDVLAQSLGAKRYIVSDTINRCTQKSFNTFVNEYRVNESILLLSEKKHETVSFESIAYDTGFNDRRNFNRVFKKTTGLSPSQFVNNIIDN